jgi:hypothetical protein
LPGLVAAVDLGPAAGATLAGGFVEAVVEDNAFDDVVALQAASSSASAGAARPLRLVTARTTGVGIVRGFR